MKSDEEGEHHKLLDADDEISFLSKGSSHSSISYVDDPHWSHWVNNDSFYERYPEHAVGHHHVIEGQVHEVIGSHEHGGIWDVDGYIGEPRAKGFEKGAKELNIFSRPQGARVAKWAIAFFRWRWRGRSEWSFCALLPGAVPPPRRTFSNYRRPAWRRRGGRSPRSFKRIHQGTRRIAHGFHLLIAKPVYFWARTLTALITKDRWARQGRCSFQNHRPFPGVVWRVSKSRLDRFTTMFHMLGWWGDSFSDKFVLDIHEEGKTKQYKKTKRVTIGPNNDVITCYPKGSTESRVDEEVHGFVSYRWQTGRTNLHMAFISTFAMPVVYGVCVLFYPVMVIIITFAVNKNVHLNTPPMGPGLSNQGYTFLPLGVAWISSIDDGATIDRAFEWFWFKVVGVAILIPLLLAGAQLLFFKRKFWLDRFCVNQTDSQLMWLSIRRMPLYLSSSKNLYCFFDDKLALYCAVRPNPKITFISVSQEKAGVLCFLMTFTLGVAAGCIKYCEYIDSIKHNDPNDGNSTWSPARSWRIAFYIIGFVSQILVRGIVYYCGRSLYHALDLLAQTEQDFDVRNCGLGSENDRSTLLGLIHGLYITFPQAANIEVGVSNRDMNTTTSQSVLEDAQQDEPAAQPILEDAPDGLETFNRFIRKNLRRHIPWSGLKSCVVLTYLPAFLVTSVNHNFIYGFMETWVDENWFNLMDNVASGNNYAKIDTIDRLDLLRFGNIFARCWGAFVSGPFDVFILGCYIKLLWMVEKRFKVHWSILYVVLFVFDIFLPLRRWFVDTFTHSLFYNMIAHNEFQIYASPFFYMPALLYYPWSGDSTFDGGFGLNVLSGGMKKESFVSVKLHPGWNVLISIWIIAVTAFIYYIYEPAFLRQYRLKGWSWICSIGKKKRQ